MITTDGVIYGGLAVVAGTLLVKYAFQVANFTGAQDWIEKYFGSGNTSGVYKIFGVLLVIIGILGITGLLHGVGAALASPFKSLFPNSN